ncbi:MAG: hypothetical protein O6761_05775 [Thaumarchaeota archaeon]|nr:hypothetical protein [Nitrososphaerota archaeon]
MNIAPVFFVVVGVVVLAGAGMLTTDMELNPQEFVAFPSVTNFDSFDCACANPDPNGSPEFGMEFCDFEEFLPNGDPNPGFIGANALMLCTWETSQLLYGNALPANYWDGEGCNVDFWTTHDDPSLPAEYAWPASYTPDSKYNDEFVTTLYLARILVSDEELIDDENIAPLRGRVTSDGVSVGTATLARQPTTQESEGTERITSGSDEIIEVVSLNFIRNSTNSTARVPVDNSPSLGTMLSTPNIQEGITNWLAKESTAALLNAAHPSVNYHFDESQVISITQSAYESETNGDDAAAIVLFRYFNNLNEGTVCPGT